MKARLVLLLATLAAGLTLAGTASAAATVVDTDTASGHAAGFTLTSTRTTTAFAVGVWTYNSDAPVTVQWQTNCAHPQNDRFGQVVLFSGQSTTVFAANRSVGFPWLGWDFCSISASYSVDFGENQDGSPIDSAVSGWLVSHQ